VQPPEEPAGGSSALLFATCIGDGLAPRVAADAIAVLRAAGVRARPVPDATCCGQPAYNAGHDGPARRVARRTLAALARGDEPVVVPAGSCASMMRLHWPRLFRGDRDEALARRTAGRVRELTEVLVEHLPALAGAGLDGHGRVAWHDSCHALRELRIHDGPRRLLGLLAGAEIVELTGAGRCCGFGGTFCVRYPDVSCAMADDRLDAAAELGVDLLASTDGGCLLQLGGRAARRRDRLRAVHVATLLAEALPAEPRA
jgi:L-lactate dehydrogenase complex protein LldE